MKRFEGIFTVMLTAYDETGRIDRKAMRGMTRRLVDAGVHGLVVLGSNGECPYLERDLQEAAVESVLEECAGAVPVIVGINERGTEAAVGMARFAKGAGADGVLLALHVFYPLDEDAVFEHYESVCSEVDVPVLFYNFPTHSHLEFSAGRIARVAELKNVVGAKETIFDVGEVKALVDAAGPDFSVFTGMCLNLTETMGVGACGAICPLPNIVPEKAVALFDALKAGDTDKAAPLQAEFYTLAPLLASTPTPHAMMKAAMRLLGHDISVSVKPPLPQLSGAQEELARSTLAAAGLI
jgi:dihydrodipicolinate synthase/N-acetylneuraminate lyase